MKLTIATRIAARRPERNASEPINMTPLAGCPKALRLLVTDRNHRTRHFAPGAPTADDPAERCALP